MREEVSLLEIQEKIYQKVLREVTEAYYENRINEVLNKYGMQDEIEYPYCHIKFPEQMDLVVFWQ